MNIELVIKVRTNPNLGTTWSVIYNSDDPDKYELVGDFSTKDMQLINDITKLIDERVKNTIKSN